METLDRVQAAFPGVTSPGGRSRCSPPANDAGCEPAIDALKAKAAASGEGYGALSVDWNAVAHGVRGVTLPLPGNGVDAASTKALLTLRNQLLPATIGRVQRRQLRRHRPDRRRLRLERVDEELDAARVRLRAHVRVPAAAGVVPLARDRSQGAWS